MEFRVARHTNNLKAMIAFYIQVLNFELLGHFENHQHYNGVFIGKKECSWLLEFTQSSQKANHTFDPDDLLVFYPKNAFEYSAILKNIAHHQIQIQEAKNPYWNTNGVLIQDPDGYGIVISSLKI